MRVLYNKLLNANSARPSRIHTERGQRLDFWQVLAGIRRVAAFRDDDRPWFAPPAVDRLDRVLTGGDVLLELGSGRSTAWFAGRVSKVVSIEHDDSWADTVLRDLAANNIENALVVHATPREVLLDQEKPHSVLKDLNPTVAVVDSTEEPGWTRLDCIRQLRGLSSIRLIVLDDSDRLKYASADQILESWAIERFIGIRRRPPYATETTLFFRQ